jgi:hypothetical protein
MKSLLQWCLPAVLLLAVAAALWQQREIGRARLEKAQLVTLQNELEKLRREKGASSQPDNNAAATAARAREETLELARLRNTVRQLRERARTNTVAAATTPTPAPQAEPSKPGRKPALATITLASAANVGHASPEATVQSLIWSLRETSLADMAACMTPAAREKLDLGDPNKSHEKFAAESAQIRNSLQAMEIIARKQNPDGSFRLGLRVRLEQNGEVHEEEAVLPFAQVGNEWLLDQAP